MKYIAGVDEAGRGPVLGPLVMSIVAIQQKDKAVLNQLGVKDSKVVAVHKRKKIARTIRSLCPHITIKASPQEIDAALRSNSSSLNELEAQITAKLIIRLSKIIDCQEVMLDLPTKNKEAYIATVKKYLPQNLQKINIDAEFKADENYVQVSAASILAKVARDSSIQSSEKKLNISMGSGYPADPNTQKSLRKHLQILLDNKVVREEWKTIKQLNETKKQSRLGDFSE